MFFRLPSRNRPYHLGSYPLETLPHDHAITAREQERPAVGDVIAFADVFEHPHRNHAVVAPGVFAVIHLMDVYAGFESARPDSGAGRLHLLVREREYAPPNFPILPLLPATGEQHRRTRSALALAQFGHRDTSQYQNQRHTVKPLKILVQD